MHATIHQVTSSDAGWAGRLRGFDPYFDNLNRALVVDDPRDIQELTSLATLAREVVFTFPSMAEIFHGSIVTRPGATSTSPPLLLVHVSRAGLSMVRWTKGIAVNLGFFDGDEFVGYRTSFAGAVGDVMAVHGPRTLFRFTPPGRERRLVPAGTRLVARFDLPGEGERICRIREVGPASIRGALEPGPLLRLGSGLSLSISLPDSSLLRANGLVTRIRYHADKTRDITLEIDAKTTEASAGLAAVGQAHASPSAFGSRS